MKKIAILVDGTGAPLFSLPAIRKLHNEMKKDDSPCKCVKYHGDNYWCPSHGHGRD